MKKNNGLAGAFGPKSGSAAFLRSCGLLPTIVIQLKP